MRKSSVAAGVGVTLLAIVIGAMLLPAHYRDPAAWMDTGPEYPAGWPIDPNLGTFAIGGFPEWGHTVHAGSVNATRRQETQRYIARHYQALRNGTVSASPAYNLTLVEWQRRCDRRPDACPDGAAAGARRDLYTNLSHMFLFGQSFTILFNGDRALARDHVLSPDEPILRANVEAMMAVPASMYTGYESVWTMCRTQDDPPQRCFQEIDESLTNRSWTFDASHMAGSAGRGGVYQALIRRHARLSQESAVPHLAAGAYAGAAVIGACQDIVGSPVAEDVYDRYGEMMPSMVAGVDRNVTASSSYHLRMGTCLHAAALGFHGLNVSDAPLQVMPEPA